MPIANELSFPLLCAAIPRPYEKRRWQDPPSLRMREDRGRERASEVEVTMPSNHSPAVYDGACAVPLPSSRPISVVQLSGSASPTAPAPGSPMIDQTLRGASPAGSRSRSPLTARLSVLNPDSTLRRMLSREIRSPVPVRAGGVLRTLFSGIKAASDEDTGADGANERGRAQSREVNSSCWRKSYGPRAQGRSRSPSPVWTRVCDGCSSCARPGAEAPKGMHEEASRSRSRSTASTPSLIDEAPAQSDVPAVARAVTSPPGNAETDATRFESLVETDHHDILLGDAGLMPLDLAP